LDGARLQASLFFQRFVLVSGDPLGTIEVAEFIGPLSRWAHDSKTAPRFIKYNMLQTMHLQEDLYALSEDCFENLAKRVDDLALQISALGKIGYGTRQNESRPESRHESKLRGPAGLPGGPGPSNPSNPSPSTPLTCVGSDGILSSNLGLWTRHATEEVASTKSTQQEADQVDQPRTSTVGEFLSPKTSKAEKNHMNDLDLLESLLESSMAKLESKLDVLLDRSRMKVPEVGLGSEDVESWKGGPGPRSRRKAPMLHPEAFRKGAFSNLCSFGELERFQLFSCLKTTRKFLDATQHVYTRPRFKKNTAYANHSFCMLSTCLIVFYL